MPDTDLKKWKVKELQKELERRGLGTEGLKADLINRLQTRLDEEEFGLTDVAGAASASLDKPTCNPVVVHTKTEKSIEVGSKLTSEKTISVDTFMANQPVSKVELDFAYDPPSQITEKVSMESAHKTTVSLNKSTESTTAVKVMTFEEKKKSRAKRFGISLAPDTDPEKKLNKEDGIGTSPGVISSADVIRSESKKRQKTTGDNKLNDFSARIGLESPSEQLVKSQIAVGVPVEDLSLLSKEELQKRLDRAMKFNIRGPSIDRIKIALRKFRFS